MSNMDGVGEVDGMGDMDGVVHMDGGLLSMRIDMA